MKIPSIQNYSDVQIFLKDLYLQNRKESGVGSYRYYAKKLGWPISYLNEVITGKKTLTVGRAVEIGNFLKLDGVDFERLIYMCLSKGDNSAVNGYFTDKLVNQKSTRRLYHVSEKTKKDSLVQNEKVIPEKIFSNIVYLAVTDVIHWAKGEITPDEIGHFLYSFPELKNSDRLKKILSDLEVAKYIFPIRKRGKIVGFKNDFRELVFSVDQNTVKHMAQYPHNYINMLASPNAKGWLTSGFVKIPFDRLMEAHKRILEVRNWILSLDKAVSADPKANRQNSLIFQIDFILMSLVHPDAFKGISLKDYE